MQDIINQKKVTPSTSEKIIRGRLINLISLLWAIFILVVFLIAQLRAMEVGWSTRDLVQFIIVAVTIVVAIFRKMISTYYKVIFLTFSSLIIGMIGFYTLGMLAGGVFFFPVTALIVALFYPPRITISLIIFSLLFLCYVALGFSSGNLSMKHNANILHASYINWSVYILCMAFFLIIASVTIFKYRWAMRRLNHELQGEKSKLEKAINQIKVLNGLLPICCHCKKIRDDSGYWNQLEDYISQHSETRFSHGICQECAKKHYPDYNLYEG